MKRITLYSTAALSFAFGAMSFAADVTGDRLNIGAGHSLSGTGATIAGGGTNTVSANYSSIADLDWGIGFNSLIGKVRLGNFSELKFPA